jgi:hypothetical protein
VGHSQTGKEGIRGSSASAAAGSVMTRSDWYYPRAVARDSITRYVCVHTGGKEDGTRG